MKREIHVAVGNRMPYVDLPVYFVRRVNGKLFLAKPVKLEYEEMDEQQQSNMEPTLRLHPDVAQDLVQAFNDVHIRPDKESITEGKLVATEKHLEDMRKLVFNKSTIKIDDTLFKEFGKAK